MKKSLLILVTVGSMLPAMVPGRSSYKLRSRTVVPAPAQDFLGSQVKSTYNLRSSRVIKEVPQKEIKKTRKSRKPIDKMFECNLPIKSYLENDVLTLCCLHPGCEYQRNFDVVNGNKKLIKTKQYTAKVHFRRQHLKKSHVCTNCKRTFFYIGDLKAHRKRCLRRKNKEKRLRDKRKDKPETESNKMNVINEDEDSIVNSVNDPEYQKRKLAIQKWSDWFGQHTLKELGYNSWSQACRQILIFNEHLNTPDIEWQKIVRFYKANAAKEQQEERIAIERAIIQEINNRNDDLPGTELY